VIYGSSTITGMHVSGHGYQEDLKWMISLMKPKYFIPIHGEYRMLHLHKKLAEAVGVEKGHTFIIRNGDVVDVQHGEARQTRKVTAGDTYVDNAGADEVGDIVLRDRKQLSEEGMLVIVVSISKENGNRISDPDSISRGFVYAKNSEELLTNINEVVKRTIDPFKDANIMGMKRAIKKEVGTFVFEQTNKKPMILPIIIAI
ncbi:ribonuclease J, partial [Butyricicoccus sp. 1XD8-22]